MTWICPECGRTFRRQGQSHECAPALSVDEYFATGPEWERPIFEEVSAHLDSLGPVVVEPVSVGIFFKVNGQNLVQLRPLTRWATLSFPLSRRLTDSRIARKPVVSGRKIYHFVNLRSAADVDDQVRGWLTESFNEFANE
jgi:hypothetical protein